jgi:uncharacterized membrane protein YphA (DoxX/SURF4 family)
MKNKILMVISGLFGLMFINAGLNKFFQYMPTPPDLPEGVVKLMTAFMETGYMFQLIAVTEIVGGILMLTNKFRALGALIILPVMVNILFFHIVIAPSGIIMAIVLFAINIWVIVENKDKFIGLVK